MHPLAPAVLPSHSAGDDPHDLALYLRRETAEAHRDLESALDLLTRPGEAGRFVHVLERFLGFHRAWEPAVAARPSLTGFAASRSRIGRLEADLRALGRTCADLAGLPSCPSAAGLARDDALALGALYVVEGSTLGGQVIARALAGQPWLPPAGLTYFNPYGADTGARWRASKAWIAGHPAAGDAPRVAQGAREAFGVIAGWVAA
jgi:heme oxygenase